MFPLLPFTLKVAVLTVALFAFVTISTGSQAHYLHQVSGTACSPLKVSSFELQFTKITSGYLSGIGQQLHKNPTIWQKFSLFGSWFQLIRTHLGALLHLWFIICNIVGCICRLLLDKRQT